MFLIDYAKTFLGTPYIYGANGAGAFDCSSFACECLMAFGKIPNKSNLSAQMIFDYLKHHGGLFTAVAAPGSVAFFGKDTASISHVEFVLNDKQFIGCAGGDSTTVTLKEAQDRGAMVRIRPIGYRKDLVAIFEVV